MNLLFITFCLYKQCIWASGNFFYYYITRATELFLTSSCFRSGVFYLKRVEKRKES